MTSPYVQPDEFARFVEEVHGQDRSPFPWQSRLASAVIATGVWPAALDLPTGTGKTTVLDIAVFAMACEAHRPAADRRVPRRTLLVVDRRTIVDQAYDRAQTIAAALHSPVGPVTARVAAALGSLGAGEPSTTPPLRTVRLRGAVPRDDVWVRNPTVPLLGVSTVDQIGSRLLFRGYGVSPAMRSIHAGLLGNDVLYFLDEVHLSRPFTETLVALRDLALSGDMSLPRRFGVVQMSATRSGGGTVDAFGLDSTDRVHPVLAKRLEVRKPLELVLVKVSGSEDRRRETFAQRLAQLAKNAVGDGRRRVAVVVNRVDTARAVDAALAADGIADEPLAGEPHETASRILVTGRMRPLDREAVEERLKGRVAAGVKRHGGEAPAFVVATQCIEAGADLDFDVMITECASLDSLVQRFGRLDRLGAHGEARGLIAVRSDEIGEQADDPIYGKSLAATWAHLERVAARGALDAGLAGNLVPPSGAPVELVPEQMHAPLLLPGYLDLWSQTRPEPSICPDLSPWLHGEGEARAEVTLLWRSDFDAETLGRITADEDDGGLSRPQLEAALTACPPSRHEALTIPIWAARDWLAGTGDATTGAVTDVEGGRHESPAEATRGAVARPFAMWAGPREPVKVTDDASALRPGSTVIVPAGYGGLHHGTWAPDSTVPVDDLGDLAQLVHRGRLVVRLNALLHPAPSTGTLEVELASWNDRVKRLASEMLEARRDPVSATAEDVFEAWLALGDTGESHSFQHAPRAFRSLRSLVQERYRAGLRRPRVIAAGPAIETDEAARQATVLIFTAELAVREGSSAVRRGATTAPDVEVDQSDVSTEDDGASLLGAAVTLPRHLADVEAKARVFATACGLPESVVADVALAAAWHDAGKADPRFQCWLVGGDEVSAAMLDVPLAKSVQTRFDRKAEARARERAGYPRGARHEILSVAMLEQAEPVLAKTTDRELFLHLVGSHHGWCRPLSPTEEPSPPVPVTLDHAGVQLSASTGHDLASVGSGIADRFWILTARYGWHGLAWLEAIVRLADHRASEDEQAAIETGGRR